MPGIEYSGYFGRYGGCYVPEVLRPALEDLALAFRESWSDAGFRHDFDLACASYIGRPTPLYHAANLSASLGGADIYIKQEGLAHTGAHKINNALGQAMLARRMGKRRIIAETGAGQHGLATAAACAKLGLDCTVYMGEVDIARQRPNVFGMEMYGATVVPVGSGSRTLKDAINQALRDWSGNAKSTHYLIGSALGPAPYPDMVREFQSVIGRETMAQAAALGLKVSALVACVGGGSNAIGFFSQCLEHNSPRLVGVEAGGRGAGPGKHAVRMGAGLAASDAPDGVVHGYRSRFLQDDDGQLSPTWSISAGLDYPGIGPQLASLGESGRVEFTSADDAEAIAALRLIARNEGILFALESAHAGAAAIRLARGLPKGQAVIVNMSGRGDKDIFITARTIAPDNWFAFLRSELEEHDHAR